MTFITLVGDTSKWFVPGQSIAPTARDVSAPRMIDAKDRGYWRTALHGVAAKGDTNTIRFLASSGANIDAVDRSGDSPLELALANHKEAAANVLAALGAKRLRGDQAQRDKAIRDQVQEDIDSLQRR